MSHPNSKGDKPMTKRRFCFTFFLLISFSLPLTTTAQTVNIPDPNLRSNIEDTLFIAPGTPITRADMERLTIVWAPNSNISNLTGLEYATNLTELYLGVGVGQSTINSNSVSDLSPLAGLTKLTWLDLDGNAITDISALAGLTNLEVLGLWSNSITDISPLARLNKLTFLGLTNNSISDISSLAGLNSLRLLYLTNNSISDISPLVSNTGLGSGDQVFLRGNPLDAASINTHIPALQRRGVTVTFDAVSTEGVNIPDPNLRTAIENALGKPSGATITVADMERFIRYNFSNRNIRDLTGLEYATNLTELRLQDNNISDISPLAGLNNLELLDLNDNSISDISPLAGLNNLERLHLDYNSISNISPLSGLNNLIVLDLLGNSISDISPLSGLNNLIVLYLGGNSISDISPLSGLNNLEALYLLGNSISDISPLSGLNNLEVLYLGGNSISDISPLSGLTDLRGLFLWGNSITNIFPLAGLNNIEGLGLEGNSISDIFPLVENTGLGNGDRVWLQENPLNSASINTHIPALQSRGVTVEFDPVITEPVDIPDPNLRAAIETELGKASGVTITTVDMAGLDRLVAVNADISDLTGLEHATNLTTLNLGAELVGQAIVNSNSVSDLSPLVGLNTLTELSLELNLISDLSPLAGLNNLTTLWMWDNLISDISPLVGLNNLTVLNLGGNLISDISALSGLTQLTELALYFNSISDISPLAGLTNLTELYLTSNAISDISPLAGLTNLTLLNLWDNTISDISFLESLTNLETLLLHNNSIFDLSSLVANTGLGSGDTVNVSENPLSSISINVHIPALKNRGVEVRADDLIPTTSEYTLSIPAGISLIHVPLRVTEVDGSAQTLESISDLYDALGGTSTVNFLITYDSMSQAWRSYFVPSDRGGPADSELGADTGIIVGLRTPASVHLRGTALGTDGTSSINLNPGLNVVGLPLNDSRITRISDLLTLEGISGNVPVIILTDGGEFKLVGRAGDPGDIEITGGQAFIMTASQEATVAISGDAWANGSGAAAAPPVTRKGIEVGDTTPVLGLRGAIVDAGIGLNNVGFRVTVKNLSTGRAVAAVTTPNEAGYRSTVVDIETGRAATVGDVLEISAQSPNPFIGVEPLRYTVTAEDVKQNLIQLPELVAYEIPAETQLLSNYPNPFNPETWIPYRLAEDAFVTLTIYGLNGQVVRTIDVGHQTAAGYESRSKAIYWDGRNRVGEQVASGVYFYHLSAGDYSATRKMLIIK